MNKKKSTTALIRIVHRYLGFFLAGIMTVYALSGVILIYRDTDFLKIEKIVEKKLKPNTKTNELGKALRMRNFKVTKEEGSVIYFKNGTYNKETGIAKYTSKQLPFILDKFVHLHKATTNSPVYWLNVFFGISLLFFAISSFFMFLPKSKLLKKGLYFAFGGFALTIILLFI
ncbi:hypothetical protein SAMN05444411_101665 [Lutibacter oricola]|uniref:PepSY-associated TM region n=1 Tax=Lutibacter oricola TaxID=762486 RepID=A0A1H2TB21_9FLAO|nr:PepSY domain-containing protein [Lutibacter oricola]SDW41136.1 hypothetical protein SAMN05444411_101665 [Lutibacter oricola]